MADNTTLAASTDLESFTMLSIADGTSNMLMASAIDVGADGANGADEASVLVQSVVQDYSRYETPDIRSNPKVESSVIPMVEWEQIHICLLV